MDWPPLRASAWLAGPAELADQPDVIVAVVQDLLQMLDSYRISRIGTGEPREYRLTRSAFQELTTAVGDRRVNSIHLTSDTPEPPEGKDPADLDLSDLQGQSGASATIWLPSAGEFADSAVQVEVTTHAATVEAQLSDAQRFAAFVRRWAEPLRVAAAFASANPHDTASRTHYEATHRLPAHLTCSAAQHYARGVFWCNLLSTALCDRLGGRARVLAEAPASIKEPVGDGIWLQLSETPPAEPLADEQMAAFLAPILSRPRLNVRPPGPPPRRPARRDVPSPPAGSLSVPITVLDPSGEDIALNVYLEAPLAAAAREAVAKTVDIWFMAGFDGASGDSGFRSLSPPSVDERGAVMRWDVDLVSPRWQRSVLDLAQWLGAIPDVTVKRLVVGTEIVE
jgi:hypothetical protein